MKRKQLLGTVIPVFMMTAVITSGYAIWHYNNLMTSDNQTLNKEVSQELSIGSITKASDFKLVFDQTKDGRINNAFSGDSSKDDTSTFFAEGIYTTWDDSVTPEQKIAKYTSPTEETKTDRADNGKIFFDVVIDFGNATVPTSSTSLSGKKLSEVVSVAYDSTDFTGITTTETYGNGYYYSQSLETSSEDTTISFDWTKVKWSYKLEPKNTDELEEFRTLVGSSTITVTYHAYIASSATQY